MATNEIVVSDVVSVVTGWKKKVTITFDNKDYKATLYWDEHDGYELVFPHQNTKPEWAIEWEDKQQYGGNSLEYTLDCIIEDMFKQVCEVCEDNQPRSSGSKRCESCNDDFKESDAR